MQINFLGLTLLVPVAISGLLAVYAGRHRRTPGALPLAVLMLALMFWSAAYALELFSSNLQVILFFGAFEYACISLVPILWLLLALDFIGRRRWLTRGRLLALLFIPLITQVLYVTNTYHHWFHTTQQLTNVNGITLLSITYGPWHHVFVAYSYLNLGIGLVLVTRQTRHGTLLIRRQAVILLSGVAVPVAVNVFYLLGIRPLGVLDPTPFAFTITGIIVAWGIFRFRLLDLKPFAREVLIETIRDGILVLDGHQRIVDINPAAAEMFGLNALAAIGQNVNAVLDSAEIAALCRAEIETRRETQCAETSLEIHVMPLFDSMHQHIGCLVTLHNVTDRKRGEAVLQESEEKYRRLVQDSPDAIAIYVDGKIVFANAASVQLMRARGVDELLGRSIIELVHPDYREFVSQRMVAAQTAGQPLALAEEKFIRLDGTTVDVEVKAIPIAFEMKPAVQIIVRDITERKQAEDARLESERQYRNLIDLLPSGVIVHSAGQILLANDASARFFGADSPAQLIGTALIERVHPDYRAIVNSRVQQAARDENVAPLIEEKLLRLDGMAFDAEVAAMTIRYGDQPAMLAVFNDITERKQAEEALRESENRYRLLYAAEQRQAQELALLDRARTALMRELDLSTVIRTVVEAIADTFGYTHVSLYLIQSNQLVLQHQVGYATVISNIPLTQGITGRVAHTGQAVLLQDVNRAPEFLAAIDGVTSEVCTPLMDQGQVVGVLNVESTGGIPLTNNDLRLMTMLSDHINIAIRHARLYAQVQQELAERIRTETDLRHLKEFNEGIVETVTEGIVIQDLQGRYRYANPAVTTLLGFTLEELLGQHWQAIIPVDQWSIVEAADQRRGSGEADRYELDVILKNGERHTVLVSGSPWYEDGVYAGSLVTFADITARKQAEEALRESQSLYHSLVEVSPLSICRKDLAGRFTFANQRFLETSNITQADLMGKTDFDLHPPELAEKYRRDDRAVMDSGQVQELIEERAVLGSESIVVQSIKTPIYDAAGKINGVQISFWDITERKRAEAALHESEARYRRLTDNASDIIFRYDLVPEMRLAYINPAVQSITGYTPAECYADPYLMLNMAHPDDAGLMADYVQQRTPPDHPLFMRWIGKDGVIRWMESRLVPVHDALGQLVAVEGITRDISERKQVEDALRHRTEHLTALQATVLDVSSPHSLPELLNLIVERAANLLGASSGGLYLTESEQRQVRCVVSYKTQGDFTGTLLDFGVGAAGYVAETGQPLIIDDYSEWTGRADVYEEKRPFQAVLSAPLLWQGKVSGVLHLLRDGVSEKFTQEELNLLSLFANHAAVAVENARLFNLFEQELTERQRAEEKIAASEAELRALFASMRDVVLVIDREGVYRKIAPTNPALLVSPPEELLGKNLRDVFPTEQAETFLKTIGRTLETRQTTQIEYQLTIEGRPVWFSTSISPMDNDSTLWVARDVTERAEAEAALHELNVTLEQRVAMRTVELQVANQRLTELDRLKDEFLSRTGHELRTPLANIGIYLKLLEIGKPEQREKYLQTLKREADRLQTLIEDVLMFSQLNLDIEPAMLDLIDLNEGIEGRLTTWQRLSVRHNLGFQLHLTQNLPRVRADDELLVQALTRLIANAVDYTLAGSVIVSTAYVDEGDRQWVTASVTDTGPGITPADLPHIFERFYRGRAAADYKTPGTGVGLSISRDIAEKLGGRLTVDTQIGVGSTFTLWLPAVIA